jgi:hypothetical protein
MERIGPRAQQAYGRQAGDEIDKMKQDAVNGFLRLQGDRNPKMVLNLLNQPPDIIKKYTDSTQRSTLRDRTKMSWGKRRETRKYDLLSKATGDVSDLVNELNSGLISNETGAERIWKLEQTTRTQREPIIRDKSLSDEEKKEQLAIIDGQLETIDAVWEVWQRGRSEDGKLLFAEEGAVLWELDNQLAKFKSKREQLPLIAEALKNLTFARKALRISHGRYITAGKHIEKALKKAVQDEESNTGFLHVSPREAGNREMNRLLADPEAKNLTKAQRYKVWTTYYDRYNAATDEGKEPTKEELRKIVRESFTDVTNINALKPSDLQ